MHPRTPRTTVLLCAAALMASLALSSCSSSPTEAEPASTTSAASPTESQRTIPESCDATQVLAAVQQVLDNAESVDTPWEPAEGTELADVINGGGLVCTFGNPRGETGVTVMWLDQASDVIAARESTWSTDGRAVSVDGADRAWFIDQSKSNPELPSWVVNVVVGEIWIQVRSGIGRSFEDSRAFVLPALQSLRS